MSILDGKTSASANFNLRYWLWKWRRVMAGALLVILACMLALQVIAASAQLNWTGLVVMKGLYQKTGDV